MEQSESKSFGRPDEKSGKLNKPNYDQRAFLHDYHSPSIYMITIRKAEAAPFLSEVKESAGGTIYCDYHPLGYIVLNQIRIFNSLHPDAPITNHVIMPDHFHFMIHVKKRLTDNVGLGRLIACLKTGVRNEYMQKYPDSPLTLRLESPLVRGFNDMILLRDGQLDKMIKYIKDNPRRYLIKKRLPDLFKISRKLIIDDKEFTVIGNIFLLKNPELTVVRFSRKFSVEEWNERQRTYMTAIANGGVLISPFIHPNEKQFFHEALAKGKGAILIQNRLYTDRDKPMGKLFDACAAGKLLIIAPTADCSRKGEISRQICQSMNALAEELASNPTSYRLRLPGGT